MVKDDRDQRLYLLPSIFHQLAQNRLPLKSIETHLCDSVISRGVLFPAREDFVSQLQPAPVSHETSSDHQRHREVISWHGESR